MAIIAKASGGGGDFTPAPAGVHQAVCVDIVDLGLLKVTFGGKEKEQHKISIRWQIAENMDIGKPFLVQKRYTLSLHEKATLRKDLESWRGRAFTDAESDGFDVENVLGANCLLNVTHAKKGESTYANVVAIMPLPKGMPKMAAVDYVRQVDRTDAPADQHDITPDADDIGF